VNDSWSELRGEIAGPPDTPYEGGNFQLEILVPETYPFNPPKVRKDDIVKDERDFLGLPFGPYLIIGICCICSQVRFLTKIWHPNISSVTGAICLDILKDQW